MDLGSLVFGLIVFAMASAAHADVAPYDLTGPVIEVKAAHAGVTLPISEVPNLVSGDQLWIKADLPSDQSAHYRLVVAFLRGATDPPPETWFHQDETWNPKDPGLTVAVPVGAQQVVIFLAPQTGGDVHTLIGAVRGRPGAFVRASLDLNQASRDRSRLDAFLAAISAGDVTDPDRLKSMSQLLARSLMIKLNTDCFQKMAELQAACLMQDQDSLVLSDGHSASMVEDLDVRGRPATWRLEVSATPRSRIWLLQRLRRRGDGHGPHLRLHPHRPIPVHSVADGDARRPCRPAAQHPAVVSRPAIGAGRRPSGH